MYKILAKTGRVRQDRSTFVQLVYSTLPSLLTVGPANVDLSKAKTFYCINQSVYVIPRKKKSVLYCACACHIGKLELYILLL